MWTPARAALTYCIVAVLGGLAAILWLWKIGRLDPPQAYRNVPGPTQYVPVPVKLQGKTVEVPVPVEVERIRIIPVEVVRKEMKWHDLQDNTVLATGVVPAYRGSTSVAAVADFKDNTMSARLVMRQEPQSLLEL
jgi:hypothetical protein